MGQPPTPSAAYWSGLILRRGRRANHQMLAMVARTPRAAAGLAILRERSDITRDVSRMGHASRFARAPAWESPIWSHRFLRQLLHLPYVPLTRGPHTGDVSLQPLPHPFSRYSHWYCRHRAVPPTATTPTRRPAVLTAELEALNPGHRSRGNGVPRNTGSAPPDSGPPTVSGPPHGLPAPQEMLRCTDPFGAWVILHRPAVARRSGHPSVETKTFFTSL